MILSLICLALTVQLVLVFVRIVLSWFPPGGQLMESAQRFTLTATEWLLGPLRRVLPPVRLGAAALDLSPLVATFGIIIVQGIIC
jgi:YggT family protein